MTFDFASLQTNPLLQMGLGLLSASGPQRLPHSFGQDLAGAFQYAGTNVNNAQKQPLELQHLDLMNKYLGAETGKANMETDRLKAWQNAFGGGSPLAPQSGASGILSGIPNGDKIGPLLGLLGPEAGVKAAIDAMGIGKNKYENVGGRLVDISNPNGPKIVVDQHPPPGYRTDMNGGLEPTPGGPADMKYQQNMAKDQNALNGTNEKLSDLATAANEVLTHPGLSHITGLYGQLPNVPGMAGADAQAKLDKLKSNVAFATLQDMRDSAKTGSSGLGRVTNNEVNMLKGNLAALDKAQSLDQMKESLQKIIDYSGKAKGRLSAGFNQLYPQATAADNAAPESAGIQLPASSLEAAVSSTPAGKALPQAGLPSGVTEADIQHTMKKRLMTRQQVLDALAARSNAP